MTNLAFKLAVEPVARPFLLTVMGESAASDPETMRTSHNMAAGSDQGVAAARSFGDLSHAVYSRIAPASDANNLMFIDYWNSIEGLMQFFSDPQVQKGGEMVFKRREPIVWMPSAGLPSFNLPAPVGRNERYVGLVHGPVKSHASAETLVTELLRRAANRHRANGLITREWYFRLNPPGQPESMDAIGVDVWFDKAGMDATYADPAELSGFGDLFTARPSTSTWQKPKGQWVEW
jgi:hypothetical protein